MKKHLIALAVAAAVAAPAAMADTTLYGLAHMSIDFVDNGSDNATNVASNSSRLGVKGSEKLGNGLTAVYQYEVTVGLDGESKSDSLFDGARNSFVGLSGSFGTALVGIHDTPYKLMGRNYDLFGDQVGDSRNLTSDKFGDLRPQNVIAYATPKMGGFSALLAYVTAEEFGNTNYDAYSMNAEYKAKMFDVAGAYEVHKTAGDDLSAYRLGAGVNFGGLRVNALYQNADYSDAAERAVYGLGAGYTFGKNVVKGQVFMADEVENSNDSGATMFAIGYDYKASKQTTLYAAYASTDNDAVALFGMNGGGHGDKTTITAGQDGSVFSVGVKHKF